MSSISSALKSQENPYNYVALIDVEGDSPLPPIPRIPPPVGDRIEALETVIKTQSDFSVTFPNVHIKTRKVKLEKMLREFQLLGKEDRIPEVLFEREKEKIKSLCYTTKMSLVAHDKVAFVAFMKEMGEIPQEAEISTQEHRAMYILMVSQAQKAHEASKKIFKRSVKKKVKEAKIAKNAQPATDFSSSSSSSSRESPQESLASMRSQLSSSARELTGMKRDPQVNRKLQRGMGELQETLNELNELMGSLGDVMHNMNFAPSDPRIREAEEAGVAAGFEKLARKSSCATCKKPASIVSKESALKICEQCKKIYYCSRECQKKDWKRHKLECLSSSN